MKTKQNSWELILSSIKSVSVTNKNLVKKFTLKEAEIFVEEGELPRGVLLLNKGKIREISINEDKEPFTTKVYGYGEFVGFDHLLREEKSVKMIASSDVEGHLMKASDFLNLCIESTDFLKYFGRCFSQELFYLIKKNNQVNDEENSSLLNWSKITTENQINSIFISKGTHNFDKKFDRHFVSSNNFKGLNVGEIIKGPIALEVNGNLPGRLIPIDFDMPSSKDLIPVALDEFNREEETQEIKEMESLEDIYGKIRKDNKYPHCKGSGLSDELLATLRMISRFYDLPFKKDFVKKIIDGQLKENKLNINQIAAFCDLIGLKAVFLKPSNKSELSRIPLPAVFLRNGRPIIIWERQNNRFFIGDPTKEQEFLDIDLIIDSSNESLEILSVERNKESPKARFGLKWFLPSIKKHKYALIQVVIASFFVQLLGLLNPLLIQQIIDAVISQGNYSSLNILGTLLIFMAFSQALLGSLRTYLFSDTTNRIDMTLGTSIIRHLLRLPLPYFNKRPVGEVSGRVGELEKIRSFLTGTALTVLLDSFFSVIYIAVLLSYSVQLTIWALGVLPLFIALTIFVSPILQAQLRRKAEASARVNSHLVESLSGMETIKGQKMELSTQWRWEQMYGEQIQAGFKNTVTSTAAGSISNFLQQLSGLIIIWAGAAMVLQGKLTLGQLIAFRILSNYVTSPLLRLASLWQNFQETSISLERLSDIVDHQEEIEIAGENLPPIPPVIGEIIYEKVNFRFTSSGPYQLLNVNFKVKPGTFVGIVGSSGSGKSTLLKLLTRLYEPNNGSIKIDGHSISKVDLYSLREQIGVVPQDSLLFDGSIQSNIALTKPDSSYEEIINAAKLACAHEFIEKLPSGYTNSVGERGSGLSGGQRQRIAIARVILRKPKLLILDEATSALDVDTEKRVIRNILDTFKGSTILFISHRLSNLRDADNILLMDEGSLAEEGNHEDLMALNGRYTTLYNQQEAAI
ncbi:MAG: ABC transporter transmembrane domain-containing protein [Prochlorococcus marinus CUG1432]|uniref:ABC transporter transmembrane domain-containing protein n=1 Tax=Prochlorococcus marinus TaxID=1219 RepID=UPI001ADCD517|nr:ABC transporter transmembrane domain-containing protein [Prochlorococcus marinus]MBO8229865.1 ATP-binding cassette domain-containing protein [Prochlorococcus marinus XMU1404]MCR8545799.1 ABC transporter transmembrane domain-containing protein [Prochlorococcus marinus CUG1432]